MLLTRIRGFVVPAGFDALVEDDAASGFVTVVPDVVALLGQASIGPGVCVVADGAELFTHRRPRVVLFFVVLTTKLDTFVVEVAASGFVTAVSYFVTLVSETRVGSGVEVMADGAEFFAHCGAAVRIVVVSAVS